jgi:alanine racemase
LSDRPKDPSAAPALRGAQVLVRVSLDALAANYALLRRLASSAEVAAVVKANAYGLGLAPIAARLVVEGCRSFFVADLAEAIELRQLQPNVRIFVLSGLPEESGATLVQNGLIPVLNTPAQVRAWRRDAPNKMAALQLDTGMSRTGLSEKEVSELSANGAFLAPMRLALVMTHLARADTPNDSLNEAQVGRFAALLKYLPRVPRSIANSAGIFLGPCFHGDLVRPGIALYGGRPFALGHNPMRPVVNVCALVQQVRDVTTEVTVGYGATHRVQPPGRIATIGIGYADGYPRCLGGKGYVSVSGRKAPVIGRVSMDAITVDITQLPRNAMRPGSYVEVIGDDISVEDVAAAAGTVNYELLTALSRRAARVYF